MRELLSMTAVLLDNIASYILNCLFGAMINIMEDTHVERGQLFNKMLYQCMPWETIQFQLKLISFGKNAVSVSVYCLWKSIVRLLRKTEMRSYYALDRHKSLSISITREKQTH